MSRAAPAPAPAPAAATPRKSGKPLHIVRPAQEDINLGERLRVARKARGLSIEQVASASGITKSFLSRLERDAVAASIATLIRVCNAMGIRPGSLFDAPETNLIRSGKGTPINLGGEAMNEYLISGSSNEHMMALLSVIEPGGGSGSEPYTLNAGSDLVHVKDGELVVDVDGVSYHLKEGDTLTFPPSLPHSWVNPSRTKKTVAVWVIVPPP
ncbi:MAG TPA: cupin domain-containing protein [Ramlibacter sp.]|uniref:helix-turn-helix domain-containing protein n=1 Tax=Ramlibacter sp. TaxID=1917967 RepID=UPI002CA8CFE7|nr:cupin domain-containing protein [Ramlibacter sp.]HVZ45168.1 cupin domain-containing protein [Ramlibacter sp.]